MASSHTTEMLVKYVHHIQDLMTEKNHSKKVLIIIAIAILSALILMSIAR